MKDSWLERLENVSEQVRNRRKRERELSMSALMSIERGAECSLGREQRSLTDRHKEILGGKMMGFLSMDLDKLLEMMDKKSKELEKEK